MEKWVDYYKLLDIPQNSSNIEVRNAYRQKCKLYHPDINHSENTKEIMQLLNEAFEVLKSPIKRGKYDIEWSKRNNLIINGINVSEILKEDNKKFKYDFYSIIHMALVVIILMIMLYSITMIVLNNSFSPVNLFALLGITFLAYLLITSLSSVLFFIIEIMKMILRNLRYVLKK